MTNAKEHTLEEIISLPDTFSGSKHCMAKFKKHRKCCEAEGKSRKEEQETSHNLLSNLVGFGAQRTSYLSSKLQRCITQQVIHNRKIETFPFFWYLENQKGTNNDVHEEMQKLQDLPVSKR